MTNKRAAADSLGTRIEDTCLPEDNLRAGFVQNISRTDAHSHRGRTFGAQCRLRGDQTPNPAPPAEPIIDIHQHLGYSGRPDAVLLTHQRAMGMSRTILLPAGSPLNVPSTHFGASNGLDAKALGNDACYEFARARPKDYMFGANEVPDLEAACRKSYGT